VIKIILRGTELSQSIKQKVKQLIIKHNLKITLAVILIGDDPASQIYIRNKKLACEYTGIKSLTYKLANNISQEYLLELINNLNNREDITGILVQLPLPKHICESVIMQNINYLKDVDGFHPINIGALTLGDPKLIPCTPLGVIKLLEHYNIQIQSQHCVIIGRSNDVGKPVAALLLKSNGTVTICHSYTQNLSSITRTADILVSAIGKAKFITPDMIKQDAILIDIGINRINNKLCGDIDFEACEPKAKYITPVPGGVGIMTIAILMQNCLRAYKLQAKHNFDL